MQGDVIALLDDRGRERERVTYTYDAWGNILSHSVDTGWNKAYELNHITYRGYYQDNESGFYYLQSRYYDSEVGRFINADDSDYFLDAKKAYYNENMYSYCNDNPIINIDSNGHWMLRIVIAGISGVVFGALAYAIGKKIGLKKKQLALFTASFVAVGVIIGVIWGVKILYAINKALKPMLYFFKSSGVKLGIKVLGKAQFEIHNPHHGKPIHFVVRWFFGKKPGFKDWWFGK